MASKQKMQKANIEKYRAATLVLHSGSTDRGEIASTVATADWLCCKYNIAGGGYGPLAAAVVEFWRWWRTNHVRVRRRVKQEIYENNTNKEKRLKNLKVKIKREKISNKIKKLIYIKTTKMLKISSAVINYR